MCFRYIAPDVSEAELDALNDGIVVALQTQGIAAPSTTTIQGKKAIRVALTNHRTRLEDMDILVAEVCRLSQQICDSIPAKPRRVIQDLDALAA